MSTMEAAVSDPALSIRGLEMAYVVRGTPRSVLRGVDLDIAPGEAFGLVGESGCGKSTTAYAALRYLPSNGRITAGSIRADGQDLVDMAWKDLRDFRANHASMVFQDPVQAMNPVRKIGPQLAESFTIIGQSASEARASALAALERVHIAAPESVLERYPHQLSGGMLQRVVIAMALACDPKLLVLDEPTTGLDATVEAEVLDLVRELRNETDAAVLLIAHNLGVVRSMCDRVGVMYAGRIVEEGSVDEVFDDPSHPYTRGLLESIPRRGVRKTQRELYAIPGNLPQIGDPLPTCVYVDRCPIATEICSTEPPPKVDRTGDGHWTACHHPDEIADAVAPVTEGLEHEVGAEEVVGLVELSKTFRQRGEEVPALVSVDLGIADGETLGLVGESGSGKSTLAKTLVGIHQPDPGGEVRLRGRTMADAATSRVEESIRAIQMVFQNPDSALNRAWTVRRILERSVKKLTGVTSEEAARRAEEVAAAMQLSERHLDMRPRQLSGGLKQRVAIARAFAGDPDLVVCDEPTSALDVSVQAAILNLLAQLQRDERTSYLFISHDIGVVRYLSDRIAVMYVGRIVELGTTDQLFDGPVHPYTEALLSAVPSVDGIATDRIPLDGDIPTPADPPPGCVFHTRCTYAIAGTCDKVEPPRVDVGGGHQIVCHLPIDELPSPG